MIGRAAAEAEGLGDTAVVRVDMGQARVDQAGQPGVEAE